MSNPPNGFNTNSNFNKFKGTYFNNDVDISGGNIINRTGDLYLAENSHIYTLNNHIQFDDVYNFINFYQNVHILGSFKLDYNGTEYNVGEKIVAIQDIYDNKIGTMTYYAPSDFNIFNNIYCAGQIQYQEAGTGNHIDLVPVVLDSKSKLTNINFNSSTNTITFGGNLQFPVTSIASTSINNSSFIDLTNAQTIAGIKRFSANMRIDGALLVSNGTITISNASLGYISTLSSNAQTQLNTITTNITALQTKTTPITYTAATTTTVISGVLQFSGTLNGFSTTNFSNAINYGKDLTSSAQTQLTTLASKLTNVSFTTPTTLITGTTETNVLKFNTSLNGMTPLIFSYMNNVTSDIQTQINNFSGVSLSANNTFTGLCKFTNNLQVEASLLVKTLTGSVTLSNDNLTRIQWLSNVTADIQSSIQTLQDLTSGFYRLPSGSYFFTSNLNTTGNFNTLTPNEIGYLTNMTENLQTAINNLKTKTTDISYSGTTTTISNTLTFSGTLNNISTTTFNYLSDVTGYIGNSLTSLQNQINTTNSNITNLNIPPATPPGTVIQSVISNLQTLQPNNWLYCNGQRVSRTTYATLFSYIGTTYGVGDANTTFNLPDFRSCFIRGAESIQYNGTTYTPNAVGTIQQDAVQAHAHTTGNTGSYLGTGTSTGTGYFVGTIKPNQSSFATNTGGVVTARNDVNETRVLNHALYFYIKT